MNPDTLAVMRSMRTAGFADSEIAAKRGISRQRVHRILGKRERKRKPAAAPQQTSRAEFATAIRAWREARGLSQSQAAKTLRVNKHTLCSWEVQRTGCSLAASIMLLMEKL